MEENLNQNISQTIPSPIEPAVVTPIPSINQPPFGSWWKVGGLILGAVILAGGIFFAGYQYSQKQVKPTPLPAIFPTSVPISPPQTITTPNPDETANWKTYTNEKDRITFRYPEGWRLTIKENAYTGYDEVTVARVIKVPMPDQPDKTIESIEEEFYVYPVSDNGKPQFTNWQPNTQRPIGGIECKGKESEGSQQQTPSRYYECIVKKTNFGISLISTKANYSTLDQILSTFQFLN